MRKNGRFNGIRWNVLLRIIRFGKCTGRIKFQFEELITI